MVGPDCGCGIAARYAGGALGILRMERGGLSSKEGIGRTGPSDNDRTGLQQTFDHGRCRAPRQVGYRVVARTVTCRHVDPAASLVDGDRYPVQGAEGQAVQPERVHLAGSVERAFPVDLRPSGRGRIRSFDAIETRGDQRFGGERTGANAGDGLQRR